MKWSIPEKVIERGRQYVKEGRVLSVTPDAGNNVWHGEVLGSELYLVDLDATAKEERTIASACIGKSTVLQAYGSGGSICAGRQKPPD